MTMCRSLCDGGGNFLHRCQAERESLSSGVTQVVFGTTYPLLCQEEAEVRSQLSEI